MSETNDTIPIIRVTPPSSVPGSGTRASAQAETKTITTTQSTPNTETSPQIPSEPETQAQIQTSQERHTNNPIDLEPNYTRQKYLGLLNPYSEENDQINAAMPTIYSRLTNEILQEYDTTRGMPNDIVLYHYGYDTDVEANPKTLFVNVHDDDDHIVSRDEFPVIRAQMQAYIDGTWPSFGLVVHVLVLREFKFLTSATRDGPLFLTPGWLFRRTPYVECEEI